MPVCAEPVRRIRVTARGQNRRTILHGDADHFRSIVGDESQFIADRRAQQSPRTRAVSVVPTAEQFYTVSSETLLTRFAAGAVEPFVADDP